VSIETTITPEMVKEYTASGYWSEKTLGDFLDQNVLNFPNKEAIIFQDQRITYRQFGQRVDRLALNFLELGFKKEDMVVVQLPNRPEFLYVFFALVKIGAVVVPVISSYRDKELDYIIKFSEAKAVVIPNEFKGFFYPEMMGHLQKKHTHLKHIIVAGKRAPSGTIPLDRLMEENPRKTYPTDYLRKIKPRGTDVAVMLITSGTEANPKGVLRTHNEWVCHAAIDGGDMRFNIDTVHLAIVPFTHFFGLMVGPMMVMEHGGKNVLLEIWSGPEEVLKLIEKEKITSLAAVAPQIIALLNYSGLSSGNLSSVRYLITGAVACPAEIVRQIHASLGIRVINKFGQSEGVGTITPPDSPPEIVAATVGSTCRQNKFKIVGDEDRVLPAEQAGELLVKGPTLFAGYYKDPDRTRSTRTADGWFHTGDNAYLRPDGNLVITGRKSDTINRGGEKISPQEVEELLYTHSKVLHASMIGMPDPAMGERNCAYIVPKPGEEITLEEIVSFLKSKGIATFKLPERLEIIKDDFPRTPSGKIRKNVLREDAKKKFKEEEAL